MHPRLTGDISLRVLLDAEVVVLDEIADNMMSLKTASRNRSRRLIGVVIIRLLLSLLGMQGLAEAEAVVLVFMPVPDLLFASTDGMV